MACNITGIFLIIAGCPGPHSFFDAVIQYML